MTNGPIVDTVILKLASRCNLNCGYCYLYNHQDKTYLQRPALMPDEVFDSVLAAMEQHCGRHAPHSMSILLHGGEPLLIGQERFIRFVDRARSVLGERLRGISLQTNAALIEDSWARILARLAIAISVSLDGPPEAHDEWRVDHHGMGSYSRVIEGIRKLQEAGIRPHVLCVINPRRSGIETYRHFLSLGLKRCDFLLPDVTHDSKPVFYSGLPPNALANYLIPIFDEWLAADDTSVEIRIFRTLLSALMGGSAGHDIFGNARLNYVAVETDGTIEGLDVLRICENGISGTGLNVRDAGFEDLTQGSALISQALTSGFPACSTCRACKEFSVCGGGYPPHRYSREKQFDNPSAWCEDIKFLLAHLRNALAVRGYAC